MFVKPIIEQALVFFVLLILFLSIDIILYYVIVFNMKFDGIDRATLKENNMMKKLIRNIKLISLGLYSIICILKPSCEVSVQALSSSAHLSARKVLFHTWLFHTTSQTLRLLS